MERRMKLSGDVPCLSLLPLGTYHNDTYYIDDECLIHLEEINIKLKNEDPTSRPLRCTVGFLDILNKDLIPILINSKDQPSILRSTIKLLAEVTTPLECLDMVSVMAKSSHRSNATQQVVIYKLTQLLYSAKESFLDGRATQVVFDHVHNTLGKMTLSSNDNESINDSMLLIRNILHATERPSPTADNAFDIEAAGTDVRNNQDHDPRPNNYAGYTSANCMQQNQLLHKLLTQGLDGLLINLLACAQKEQWMGTIVQLVSLLYKDRPVENILAMLDVKKCANPASTSESSFDNEEDQYDNKSSRQSTSSGFHSDDSNAPSNFQQEIALPRVTQDSLTRKSERKSKPNENSPGNKSPFHKFSQSSSVSSKTSETKSLKGSEKQEKTLGMKCRRQIEIKTGSSVIDCKRKEEDISNLLKEFTINFILHGYGTLVGELHQQLLKQGDAHPLDKSHFLWLISYFLPIACQLNDVNMEHLKDVLTIDLLCYLTWEAVHETEKLEMCALQPYSAAVDLKANARRLHLCVKAIREYLKTLERLSRSPNLNNSGFTQIGCENSIIQLDGYVPAIRDLRQLFLLQLRQFNPIVQCRSYLVDVISANHILLLTLERVSSHQQQPSFDFNQHLTQFCSKTILDRYGTALEDFKNNGPYVNDCILTLLYHVAGDLGGLDLLCEPAILRPFSEIWKQEFDMRDEWNDLIECVVQKSLRNFQKRIRFNLETSPNSRNRSQDSACYLMDILPMEYSEEVNVKSIDQNHITDIELLVVQLKDSGFQKQLDWIQSSLLSACATRLGTFTGEEFRNPVTSLSFQMDLSCPVVPWTEMEASALRSELFVFLLFRIGLFPAQAVLYPRIPCEWSPDTLYSVALLFGPVEQERIDFNLTLVKKIELYFPNWKEQSSSCCCYAIREGVSFSEDSYLKCGEEIPRKIASIPHSPWLLDSLSTTSSLEVHKTDSSDDEDMVDGSRSSS